MFDNTNFYDTMYSQHCRLIHSMDEKNYEE